MNQTEDQKTLILLLVLTTVCGVALVVANTNSFKPSFATGNTFSNDSQIQPNKLSRAKRVAIYNGQGVIKFVCGVAHPVKQTDKEQSFWFFYNFQSQYTPTPIPLYYWSFWNTSTFVSTARQLRKGMQATLQRDDTRLWLYNAIETGMEQLDGSERGANCLLRSICEVSQLPFEDSNIFSEVLNAVLIPTVDNVEEKYINARDAGRGGADCLKTFDCSTRVWNWLTHMTKLSL